MNISSSRNRLTRIFPELRMRIVSDAASQLPAKHAIAVYECVRTTWTARLPF